MRKYKIQIGQIEDIAGEERDLMDEYRDTIISVIKKAHSNNNFPRVGERIVVDCEFSISFYIIDIVHYDNTYGCDVRYNVSLNPR